MYRTCSHSGVCPNGKHVDKDKWIRQQTGVMRANARDAIFVGISKPPKSSTK